MTMSAPSMDLQLVHPGLTEPAGAVLSRLVGGERVIHYGDAAREARCLREGSAAVDRSHVDALALVGADRQRFLNGLVTCDVKALAPGTGAYGFFTDGKGRVLSDVVVLALADALWLELPPGRGAAIAEHLAKYIIADRVEVRPLERRPLALAGPSAAAALGVEDGIGASAEPAWRHGTLTVAETPDVVVRDGRMGVPSFSVWVEPARAATVWRELLRRARGQAAGDEALDRVRIESGLGRFGQDFGPENFPQETGAEAAAVSYTKGCYLGQEIVARIHYRGGVQRRLRGLRFDGAVPPLGTTVLAEDRDSGAVTSAVHSPAHGAIGLAVLHQRVGDDGTEVALANGQRATLVSLPFTAGPA